VAALLSVVPDTVPLMREPGYGRWEYRDYCDAVEIEVARFVDVVRGVDPAVAVPNCPGWTMAHLVKHHGTSQRRVKYVVRHRSQEPVWAKDVETGLPDDPTEYSAWFAAGAGPLVATLRAADPDAPMWTNGADQHVRYWARRILFEAVVHRADAELALGRRPHIGASTAVDGIDELLTNMPCFPWIAERQRELNRPGETLHLGATEYHGEWMITLHRGGFTWKHEHGPATVAVRGTAGDLLLLSYGRLAPADPRFAITGDDQLLTQWLESSAL